MRFPNDTVIKPLETARLTSSFENPPSGPTAIKQGLGFWDWGLVKTGIG